MIEAGPKDTPGELVMKKTYAGEDLEQVKAEFEEYIRKKEGLEALLVFKE